jgi:hypothetical protein
MPDMTYEHMPVSTSNPTTFISMAMEPSCLDGSKLLLAGPGPYHQVTNSQMVDIPQTNTV